MFASDNCILKSCYRELVLNCTKFTSWATYVRNLLCSLGLSYLWKNRWLLNTDCSILSIICHRLLYQTKQELNSLLEASSKCIVYKCIVSNIDLQFYLQKNIPAMFQKCITKIRLSSHNLFIETGRYIGIVWNEIDVAWMYWRTNSILFCNVQSIMICVKNTLRNSIGLDHLLLNWFNYCQWKTGKNFVI